jgi:TetR/AcrR family transcriptional regulator
MSESVAIQILDAANRLFAERGYDGTSLQVIAEAVGIRKPSLLYHYASKAVLRDAVLARLMDHWAEVLPQILSAATTGERRFEALVGEVIAFFDADPSRARLLYREILDRPQELSLQLGGFLAPWITLLADYIRRGQIDGLIRPGVDPEVYISNVIQMVIGGVATSHVFHTTGDDSAVERQVLEVTRIARTALFVDDYLEGNHG